MADRSAEQAASHRHGWDCFRTSGGYMNAMEVGTPLADRIEGVYKTAYRTGEKNGSASRQAEVDSYRGILEDILHTANDMLSSDEQNFNLRDIAKWAHRGLKL